MEAKIIRKASVQQFTRYRNTQESNVDINKWPALIAANLNAKSYCWAVSAEAAMREVWNWNEQDSRLK